MKPVCSSCQSQENTFNFPSRTCSSRSLMRSSAAAADAVLESLARLKAAWLRMTWAASQSVSLVAPGYCHQDDFQNQACVCELVALPLSLPFRYRTKMTSLQLVQVASIKDFIHLFIEGAHVFSLALSLLKLCSCLCLSVIGGVQQLD